MLRKLLLALFALSTFAYAQQPMNHNSVVEINENDTLYKEGKILIKIFDELAHIDLTQDEGIGNNGQGIPAITQLNEEFQVTSVKKLFGFVKKINKNPHDLTTIYEIEYDAPLDPKEVSIRYNEIPEIEFAEPDYIASILINPNDPYYADGSQWYHDDVSADEAWELSTGDATQIIGIIDTGVDWEHDDLEDNIWVNQAELDGEEGVDDDDNGFVDDIRGWDFVNDDNNPADDNSHGTHVAGIAGAKTNNNIGIAGIAWNAKLMAIKVMQSSGRGSWSDIAQGVAYAADNGATVANMSLGGYSESLTLKTALENAYHYSVIVAAAGNDGLCMITECPFKPSGAMYPACYPWVLGVQASTTSGGRALWSNFDPSGPTSVANPYGYNYEVLAPGSAIYSTIPGNGYRYLSGTSMATPVTSGAVALIKSYLPNSSHEQVFARIIQASGSGVLDIEEAMTLDLVPDVRLESFTIIDTLDGCDDDGRPDAGETFLIRIDVKNYGGLAENVQAVLRFGEFEDQSVLNIDDSISTFGNVSAYARVNNDANPIQVTIPNDVSNNRDIVLNITFSNDTDEATYTKNIVITAQNGEELKGYNPGLTHLKANRYYLLTENAVFDSLIIDPGVELNAYENTNIGIYDYFISDGKVDSLIYYKSVNGMLWKFLKKMDENSFLNFSYSIISELNIGGYSVSYNNCVIKNNRYIDSDGEIISSNFFNNIGNISPYPYRFRACVNSVITNNTYIGPNTTFPLLGIYESMNSSYFNNYKDNFQERMSSIENRRAAEHTINQMLPNYFGSTKQTDIDFEIYDYFEASRLPITTCSNFLPEPHPDVHGHTWKILLNDEEPYYYDLDPYGNETVKFDVFFSRSMDTTVTPFLTFGVREPYTQKAVVDSARWVNWKRDSLEGDTYYNIQISLDSTFATIDYEEDDVLGLDFEFNLEPDTHYFWRVRYKNGTSGDWHQWSDVSNFWTVPSGIPDAPEITYPENNANDLWTDFELRWEENPYAQSYDIQLDDNNDFSSPEIDGSAKFNYYNATGLTRGETYYARVRTNNAFGTSDWSEILTFSVVGVPPVGPELIEPFDSAEGVSYRTEFRWKELDWADSYRIQVATDSLFNSLWLKITTSDFYYSEAGWNNHDFYWRVKAYRGSIEGEWSEVYHFTGNDEETESEVTVITPADSSSINVGEYVTFKWKNAYNAREYLIEIYDSYDKANKLQDYFISYPDSTFIYDNELLNIGEYFWRIRVNGKNGWEAWSDLYMFQVTNTLTPKPLLSVPTNNMKWYDTTLTFKWNNAPGANTVYNARWQAYHTMDFTTGDGLQMIRVAGARDNEGFEIPIEWNRFEFEVQATAALSNDFIALGEVGKIDLEWGMPDAERDILGFNLYRCVKQDSVTWGDTVKVNNILVTDSTFTDYDIIPDSTYYYVYRIVRTTLDEGEDSRMVSASAYPTVLDPPNLEYPPNDTTKLPINLTFDWDEPSGATSYFIKIAKDIDFTNIVVDEEVTQSEYIMNGLSSRTRYYWKVKAEGVQGASLWSETRTFLTIPVIPDIPDLVYPENNEVSLPLSITFDWDNAYEADTYQIQISDDQYFANIIFDIANLNYSYKSIGGLAIDKTYYWRVRSKNDAGYSNWSERWLFTTDTEGAEPPPASWDFTDNTGTDATIVVPKNINPQINGRDILSGDGIGAFYLDEGEYKCAGYVIWEGQNAAFTVWGDDTQTDEKDGFATDEKYRIKLWDSRAEEEFFTQVTFGSGPDYFTSDGYSVLGYLSSVETTDHDISMNSGWNLISSYVEPSNPDIESVFGGIEDDIVIVKNGDADIYIPNMLNSIGNWTNQDAYYVYANANTTLTNTGFELNPESEDVNFEIGWNLVSYLRNNNMNIEIALEALDNELLIAKNGIGRIYLPSYNINTIGNMKVGDGYKMFMTQAVDFNYPSNDELGKVVAFEQIPYIEPQHYINDIEMTDNNMTLILRANVEALTETAVFNEKDEVVGSAVFSDGIAVVTIWGEDETEYKSLHINVMNAETQVERIIELNNFIDLTDNTKAGLKYEKDAVLIGDYFDENGSMPAIYIRPNPFSTEAEIEYFIPENGNVEISLYNEAGSKIQTITDTYTQKGLQKARLIPDNLSSGTYNIIMKYNGKTYFEKAVYVR